MGELENLLQNVPGTYEDFNKWVLMVARETDSVEDIKKHIEENPNQTDEELGEWIEENFPTTDNNDEIPEWAQDDEED